MHPKLTPDSMLLSAIETWVNGHPNPNEPAFQIFGTGRTYSAMQLLEEMRKETATGKLVMRVLKNSAKNRSLEEVITSFTRKTATTDSEQTAMA